MRNMKNGELAVRSEELVVAGGWWLAIAKSQLLTNNSSLTTESIQWHLTK